MPGGTHHQFRRAHIDHPAGAPGGRLREHAGQDILARQARQLGQLRHVVRRHLFPPGEVLLFDAKMPGDIRLGGLGQEEGETLFIGFRTFAHGANLGHSIPAVNMLLIFPLAAGRRFL